jgi:hypothetical protein
MMKQFLSNSSENEIAADFPGTNREETIFQSKEMLHASRKLRGRRQYHLGGRAKLMLIVCSV